MGSSWLQMGISLCTWYGIPAVSTFFHYTPECMVLLSVPDQIRVKPYCLLVIISWVTWKQSTIISLYLIWSLFYSITKEWLWPCQEQYDYSCWSCLGFRKKIQILELVDSQKYVFTLQPRLCNSSVMQEFTENLHLHVRTSPMLSKQSLSPVLALPLKEVFPLLQLLALNIKLSLFLFKYSRNHPVIPSHSTLIRKVELLGFIRKIDAEDWFLASLDR